MGLLVAATADFQLPGIWNLTPYGAVLGLVVLMFWLTSTGRYIPRASHERELAARDTAHSINLAQANHRGDEWKETALDTRALNNALMKQNSTLIEATKTPAEFFGTVMREGGGSRVAQANTPGP